MSSQTKYQPHIDGLRAVAVVSVIFYHFGTRWFRGGYVGVDVFFVISGFLITRLILDEMYETGNFGFARFYIRRMRRLFPALSVTLALTFIPAVILFSPGQFQRFGRSLAAASVSLSNILFWQESGYFDVDSRLKPLLHTWSLSVEDQFYLIWPAFLWLALRTRRGWHPHALGLLGLASFALNHLWVVGRFDSRWASSLFFLTPFRIFELCLGAAALYAEPFFKTRRWACEAGMLAGLAVIAYAVVSYNDRLIFPYYYALVPCFGALFVIVSGESRLAGWIVTNPAAVGTGLISYSLYLIHWPALVFAEELKHADLIRPEKLEVLGVTIALAILMYFFVEKPFRRNAPTRVNSGFQKGFVLSGLATMAVIAAFGLQIGASAGWAWRNPRALTATQVAAGMERRFKLLDAQQGCRLYYAADPRFCKMDRPIQVLVFGDSHEVDGYNAFATIYGPDPTINLISFGAFNDCDVQFNESGPYSTVETCRGRLAMLSDPKFVSSLRGLVFSQNTPFHEASGKIWRIIGHLKRMNPALPVAVLGGFINTTRECSELYAEFHSFNACKDPRFVRFSAFNERESYVLPDEVKGLAYVYVNNMRLLCADGTLASCLIEADGEPAFYDMHHLSLGFSMLIGRRIASVYGDDLERAGFPPIGIRK